MTKQCIMCENPAGSKEHIFPAALGGRRVDKGIYCGPHNNELGSNVTALLETLALFNAALGIRSDHHASPKPFLVTDDRGDRFNLLHDAIEVAPPPSLRDTPELLGKPTTLTFSSRQQFDRWRAEQRKLGFEVQATASSPVQTQYFTKPIKVSLSFGSEPFRRGIAYVGLTYLAHYFPEISRQDGLLPIKSCVLGKRDLEDRVWWVDPDSLSLSSNPNFRRVHSVAIHISHESKRARALVAFFGKICMAVDLGSVETSESICITTHINPFAEGARPDHDIYIHKEPGGSLPLGTAEEGQAYLDRFMRGEAQNPVNEILSEIHEIRIHSLVSSILKTLKEAESLPEKERVDIVNSITDQQSQRILNLLQQGVREFLEKNLPMPASVRRNIENLIAEDPNSPDGLSSTAFATLVTAKAAIAAELIKLFGTEELTSESIEMLFAGGPGLAIVSKAALYSVLDKL